MTSRFVKVMVDKFLGMTLPATVHPDGVDGSRSGTNLLTATEAEEVFQSVLDGVAEDAQRWRYAQMFGLINADDMAKIDRSRGVPSDMGIPK